MKIKHFYMNGIVNRKLRLLIDSNMENKTMKNVHIFASKNNKRRKKIL